MAANSIVLNAASLSLYQNKVSNSGRVCALHTGYAADHVYATDQHRMLQLMLPPKWADRQSQHKAGKASMGHANYLCSQASLSIQIPHWQT
jgi:hypothetical protein